MYPYLFGIKSLRMYDLIGIGGYLLIFLFFFRHRRDFQRTEEEKSRFWLPLAVHLITYTFGGQRFGDYIGRATEFFGYIAVSAVAMVLTAMMLEISPLRCLDRTVPLYAALAAVLKLSCFCSGCCHGLPWVYGLYNHQNGQHEFPIQLVEAAVYAALFFLLRRYKGRSGQRFALFLAGYSATRFLIQFFRADIPVYTLFHWVSLVFLVVGALLWVVLGIYRPKEQPENHVSRET